MTLLAPIQFPSETAPEEELVPGVKAGAGTIEAGPSRGAGDACLVPLPPGTKAKPNTPKLLRKDLRTLGLFVRIYCHAKHENAIPVSFKGFDIKELTGKELCLCKDCSRLLHHAFIKRTNCPRDPKPQCKDCPTHCYAKVYRQQIREVMRFSGMRLLLRGRIDYLLHLLF